MLNRQCYSIARVGSAAVAALAAALAAAGAGAAGPPEVLQSLAGLPPHLVGRFGEPAGFQQAADGSYFVFDRRSQIVFGVDDTRASAWEIVHIGSEPGRIINPVAFAVDPSGTFVVNVVGCLAFGLILGFADGRMLPLTPTSRLFLLIGVLGGFTTFSTFTFETFQLVRGAEYLRGALNAGGQVVAGYLAMWAGFAAARALSSSPRV